MIHVAFDLSSLAPQKSGVGVYTESLIRHLQTNNEALEISGYSSGSAKPILADMPEFTGYRHVPIPTRALYTLWDLFGMPCIERIVGPIDIYHGTNYVLPPTRVAKRVITIHDLSFLQCPELCPPEVVKPYANNVSRFCNEADTIIAVSQFTKNELVNLLDIPESKIKVIYESLGGTSDIHIADVSTGGDTDSLYRPYILFVGTLEKRKNIMGLLKVFNDVHTEIPHHLVLAGKPGYGWSLCSSYIEEHGLADKVHVLGYVSDEEKTRLYREAELFVYPSLYEGFGIPILEAFAGGCPVVTMDTASLPEVAGDAAVYARVDEPDDLARCVRDVLQDTSLQVDLRRKGHEQLSLFSWDKAAQETVDVYRELLS